MKVRVISEIKSAKGVIPVGRTLEVSPAVFEKLKGKVELLAEVRDPYNFSHYCKVANSWCSEKLPDSHFPEGCIRIGCEYHHGEQDAPQVTND